MAMNLKELDNQHACIREKLYALGFEQPLPINAMGLVSELLDDLIKITENLKGAKQQINSLNEEKIAWNLGCEPYKCDNSRLLAECNQLHQQQLRQRDHDSLRFASLSQQIRRLEIDKHHLIEHNSTLEHKLRDLEELHMYASGDGRGIKQKKDGDNSNRKPFVSTVRSGYTFPQPLKQSSVSTGGGGGLSSGKCSNCTSSGKCDDNHTSIKKLEAEIKNQTDLTDVYKKQIEGRDREISRLNNLLTGGRPAAALGKDCCYRGVGTLQEDVQNLQRDKALIQEKLDRAGTELHEAMNRAMDLASRNEILEHDMEEMATVALSVERDANAKLLDKQKYCDRLKSQLENVQKNVSQTMVPDNEKQSLRNELKGAIDEKNALLKKISILEDRDGKLLSINDKLIKKIAKAKVRVDMLQKKSSAIDDAEKVPKSVQTQIEKISNTEDIFELNRLKSEKDYFQREYLQLLAKPDQSDKIADLEHKLLQNQSELDSLRRQQNIAQTQSDGIQTSRSAMHRAERERDVMRADIERLTVERDELRKRLQIATDIQKTTQQSLDDRQQNLLEKLENLEIENRRLITTQIPSRTTIEMLREEVSGLRAHIFELEKENSKLKTSYNQIRILQEQTDKALTDYQNRLTHTEHQLGHAESRISTVDSNRNRACSEIRDLRDQMAAIKHANKGLEEEKDKLIMELDNKTEKLYNLEAELNRVKLLNKDMESNIDTVNRKLRNATCESNQNEDTLRRVSSEADALRKQIAQLKRVNDNALAENSRLVNELSDQTSQQQVMVSRLKATEKEVERLKGQLQQYVQEVERAEDLLMRKEEEREEILEHYRTLSQDAVALEGNNHSLELEANEAKRSLMEAEAKIADLQEQLVMRDSEICNLETQLESMSNEIATLQAKIESSEENRIILKADADAVKDLCSKLDFEKEKLNAELNECMEIRQKLERENAKLRNDMTSNKTGDKAAVDSLQELLSTCRQELEQSRIASNRQNQDIEKLRGKIDELQEKLTEEHSNSLRNETLAKEYSVQIQELRQQLTDDRFAQARTKEQKEQSKQDGDRRNDSSLSKNARGLHSNDLIRSNIDSIRQYKTEESTVNDINLEPSNITIIPYDSNQSMQTFSIKSNQTISNDHDLTLSKLKEDSSQLSSITSTKFNDSNNVTILNDSFEESNDPNLNEILNATKSDYFWINSKSESLSTFGGVLSLDSSQFSMDNEFIAAPKSNSSRTKNTRNNSKTTVCSNDTMIISKYSSKKVKDPEVKSLTCDQYKVEVYKPKRSSSVQPICQSSTKIEKRKSIPELSDVESFYSIHSSCSDSSSNQDVTKFLKSNIPIDILPSTMLTKPKPILINIACTTVGIQNLCANLKINSYQL